MEPEINFIDRIKEPIYRRQRKRKFGRFFLYFILAISVVISVFSFSVIFANNSLLKSFARFPFRSKSLGQDDRINILILGMGGAGHEGPFLTDTIILAGIRPSTKQVALISVPRDLYVPIPGYGWNKVNYANALGEADGTGTGPELASQAVSKTFSTPIDWWVRVDFTGFERLVDLLGGIDVYVERSFVDTQYPAPDFQYQTISFKKGWQKMSGARALQFVRSRHGSADEGSDFARSRRQQKIILAVREKLLDLKILTSPKKIWSMFNILKKYVITNLDIVRIVDLAGLVRNIPADKIISRVIDGGEDGLLYPEVTIDGAYILKTKSGNFDELAEFARNVFDN